MPEVPAFAGTPGDAEFRLDALAPTFDPELPRLDNGKLYKRLIEDRYWSAK